LHAFLLSEFVLHTLPILILLGEENLWSSSLCCFFQSYVTLSLFGPNILLSALFSNIVSLCSFHNVRDQVSHPYSTTYKIIDMYILIFTSFWQQRRQTVLDCNDGKHYQNWKNAILLDVTPGGSCKNRRFGGWQV
jgi:hypothetical protein